MKRWSIGAPVALIALSLTLLAAPVGAAKDGDVLVAGSCTSSSASKLKLSEENGRIEVEFEVDQNRNGVRWTVRIVQNGKRIARLTRVTRAPSGSFEARVLAPDKPGADSISARAISPSGERCTARASF
jgi:hypothetical protein